MRFIRYILTVLALCCLPIASANASSCFWVGGTGNWNNSNTASWASSTGGTASTCAATGGIPKNTNDIANFDANSGGGTVTVCGPSAPGDCPTSSNTLSLSGIGQISMQGFTGTLDFSANNPTSVTMATFVCGSTGTGRTINFGSGTWTLSNGAAATALNCGSTGATFNGNTATFTITGTGAPSRTAINLANGYNLTNNTVNIGADSGGYAQISTGGAATIGTLNLTAPINLKLGLAGALTITNAPTWTGTSSNVITLEPLNLATVTLTTSPTITWATLQGIHTTAGTCNPCLSGGGNSGITITAPTNGGGGGFIIGGG